MPSRLRGLAPQSRAVVFAKAGLGLHAMVTSAGLERRRAPDPYSWHGLRRGSAQFALFQYTLAGEGRLTYEGRLYRITPGQAMLLFFPHDNHYGLAEGGAWEFFYLCLNGSEVMRAWHTAVGRRGPTWVLCPRDPLLRAAAGTCADLLTGRVQTPWQASARAYTLAMGLMQQAQPSPAASPRHRLAPLQRAVDLCRARPAGRLSVADLANAAGYSRFHFTRLFTQSEGMPPGEFIQRQRLALAVQMLQTTALPIKAVALRCGFRDPQYFGRSFRKAYGVPPGSFRRSGMYGTL